MDDESDDETIAYHGDLKKSSEEKLAPYSPTNKFPGVPIVAPKPGYAAPVSALAMPEPAVSPVSQGSGSPQMAQMNFPVPLTIPARGYMGTPVPSMPHPLQAPMTPITPAFARPPKSIDEPSVKFEANNIMRGQAEETPLARRGQRGDDFWRRFSMVVKDEGGRKSTRQVFCDSVYHTKFERSFVALGSRKRRTGVPRYRVWYGLWLCYSSSSLGVPLDLECISRKIQRRRPLRRHWEAAKIRVPTSRYLVLQQH